jgi:hypothetical protein
VTDVLRSLVGQQTIDQRDRALWAMTVEYVRRVYGLSRIRAEQAVIALVERHHMVPLNSYYNRALGWIDRVDLH